MAYAPDVFGALRGIFCVYKPAGSSMRRVVQTVQLKLAKDLNSMKQRPMRTRLALSTDQPDHTELTSPVVTSVPDLADHPLVVGERYLPEEFSVQFTGHLMKQSSGVTVMAVGGFRSLLRDIGTSGQLSVYHVKGVLGMATQNYMPDGVLIEKTTYHHVNQAKMDRVLSGMEAGHQKNMFIASGVDLQSQEAYELAAQGMLRPRNRDAGPVIYCLKCIHFQPPDFTLEIHAINEDCHYLTELVNNLGLMLKTTAVCSQVRRIRYGHFSLPHALLQKHWLGEPIIQNIAMCTRMLGSIRLSHPRLAPLVEKPRLAAGETDR